MNPNGENNSDQPTHEAQRVVIPFDIDTTEVERKIERLEQRMKALTGQGINTVQSTEQPTRTERGDQNDIRDRQAILAGLGNVQNLLRQINDTVQLIYSENPNGNR